MKNLWKTIKTFDKFQWWCKLCTNPTGGNFGGKPGRFTRGCAICLTLSTKCNLKCSYCPLLDNRDHYPHWDEYGLEDWQEYITKFPEWVALVSISGGEPTLVKWLPDFTNWLLNTGRKVTVFTNMFNPAPFQWIQVSSRLQIQATYHKLDDRETFLENVKWVEATGHKVDVVEINYDVPRDPNKRYEEVVKGETHYKPFINYEIAQVYERQFHAPPDAPKTRAVYCGAEWTYADKVIWREK